MDHNMGLSTKRLDDRYKGSMDVGHTGAILLYQIGALNSSD